jgi:putative Ca2+/H+ antiporter (TMEM165/GDT1 family)
VFSSTLGLLFLVELGDKTQLAVLSLSSQQRYVWPALFGGALAPTRSRRWAQSADKG